MAGFVLVSQQVSEVYIIITGVVIHLKSLVSTQLPRVLQSTQTTGNLFSLHPTIITSTGKKANMAKLFENRKYGETI